MFFFKTWRKRKKKEPKSGTPSFIEFSRPLKITNGGN